MATATAPASFFKELNRVPGDIYLKIALVSAFSLALLANKEQFITGSHVFKAAFLACIATVVYRIWFHPLSCFRGPRFAAAPDWYCVYRCAVGDRNLDFRRLHDEYGSIARYGLHRIAINTNTGLRDVYAVRANCQKSQYFGVFCHFFKMPMSMTTIDRKAHASNRRIDAKVLTSSRVHALEAAVLKNVRKFCDYMIDGPQDEWSAARNMSA
ncbi:hypothetical protein B0J14DRAFT_662919 [Halenospora varia]|nr:hypothetical protein B0J14DRAFT_662919 [Halenospora varia]